MSEIQCLDHGFVALLDVMGDDRTAARTARTSFRNRVERTEEEDARLTSYLVRNGHNTPLEFCQVRYHMKMPITVARQLVRHRTASINEISLRYVRASREFYVPTYDRMQKKALDNKQGSSDEVVENPALCAHLMANAGHYAFDKYEDLLAQGLAPELARGVLPLHTYTEWVFQQDLHNLLHLLKLRLHPHAQYETKIFAEAMLELIRPVFPTAIAAWCSK